MTILPPGIHYGVGTEEYRTLPGINQSLLKCFGKARTPAHFISELESPKDETPSLRIGNYVDTSVYNHIELSSKFTVWDKRRQGNNWESWKLQNSGKTILNEEEHSKAIGCLLALSRHEDSRRIIKVCRKQVVVVADHPVLGHRMKGCIDLDPDRSICHPDLGEFIFDIKTTEDASDEGFWDYVFQFGYHIQASYYIDLMNLCGVPVERFGFIAVENHSPWGVKIHKIEKGSAEYNAGVRDYTALMQRYTKCVESNHWPGYDDQWSDVRLKPWQLANRYGSN